METMAEEGLDLGLESQLDDIIRRAGLRRPENEFFGSAHAVEVVNPVAALSIARQWQSVTKAFMFTTIAGLGAIARELNAQEEPDRSFLGAFQTAYRVIGDDLCNLAPVFSTVSPQGAHGIHYLWWADSITVPLAALAPESPPGGGDGLPEGVTRLMENMTRLADDPLGPAVQLRVVESIALDIAVAFRRIYSKVLIDGQKVFPTAQSLSWIDSHIKAETGHAASVCDDEAGMTALIGSTHDRTRLAAMVEQYALNWSHALHEFSNSLAT
jgi:hypothetical protein